MKNNSIKVNFIMNSLLTISSFIFPLITFPYISRTLQPEGIGNVNFALSIIAYFSMFAQLGIPTYGINSCAKLRDDKEKLSKNFQEIFLINIVVTLVSYIIFFLMLFNIPRMFNEKKLFIVVSISIILNTIGVEWLYKSLEKYTYITIRSLIFKVIAIIAMFLLIKNQGDYVIYGIISIFASSASNILNFFNLKKEIKFEKYKNYEFKKHIKPILVFFTMSCATTIYTNMDTVMLGFIKENVDVGYYSAAVKIKNILVSIVASLGTVLLPRAAYYIDQKMISEFKKIISDSFNFVFLLGCPLVIYFILYSYEGILFLSGNSYINAVMPMQIVMPTVLIIGLTNIMGIQIMVPLGLERKVLFSVIGGASVNLFINALLIPKYSSVGAAIGTLIAEIIVWIIQFAYLEKDYKIIYKNVSFLKINIALIVSGLFAVLIKFVSLNNFIKLLIASSVFFSVYLIVLVVLREEMVTKFLIEIINKLKKGVNNNV